MLKLKCPGCGNCGPFYIEGSMSVVVSSDGSVPKLTVEPFSKVVCGDAAIGCGFVGAYWQLRNDLPVWVATTDWKLLYTQKQELVKLLGTTGPSSPLIGTLEGILGFMDAVQDWAADDLEVPDVYPPDYEGVVSV